MSRTDTWMPLYIGDYLADTRRLTTVEHGAYLLLLMEQWRRGWLPDDDQQLARITGMRLDHWRKAAGNLRPYFDAGDVPGTIRQKRLHVERERAMGISVKRADAARAKAAGSKGEGGGGSGAKSAHVTAPDLQPKPLINGHVKAANAEQMPEICTTQLQLEKKEERKEPPLPPKGGESAVRPEWLDAQAWEEWNRYRKGRKWTLLAANLSIAALDRFRSTGDDPAAVIHQSIAAGWTGLFALKNRPAAAPAFRNGFAQILHEQRLARGFIEEADDAPVVNRFITIPGSTRRDN